MSGRTWDRDLSDLADRLGQEGAIDPAQAAMLRQLVGDVGSLTRRGPRRGAILVRTAVPLAPEQRSRLQSLLEQRFGPGRPVNFEVDPELLGGVWLRVGDRIVDGSLRGRLQALRQQLATVGS